MCLTPWPCPYKSSAGLHEKNNQPKLWILT